jgi:hypothetical protein
MVSLFLKLNFINRQKKILQQPQQLHLPYQFLSLPTLAIAEAILWSFALFINFKNAFKSTNPDITLPDKFAIILTLIYFFYG